MNTPRLLSTEQLAELLEVKQCYIRRLVWERRIPYCKIGKFVRFDPIEIGTWLERTRRDPLR